MSAPVAEHLSVEDFDYTPSCQISFDGERCGAVAHWLAISECSKDAYLCREHCLEIAARGFYCFTCHKSETFDHVRLVPL